MNAQIIKIDKELIDHDYLFIIIRDLICKNENNNKQRNYIIIKKFKNQPWCICMKYYIRIKNIKK